MEPYVLVHGAWHTGKELEPVANTIGGLVIPSAPQRSKETGQETRNPSAWMRLSVDR